MFYKVIISFQYNSQIGISNRQGLYVTISFNYKNEIRKKGSFEYSLQLALGFRYNLKKVNLQLISVENCNIKSNYQPVLNTVY